MINVLFTIPIYYRSKEKYYGDEQKELEDIKISDKKFYPHNWNTFVRQHKWPPWEFNDIIGYLKIYEIDGLIKVSGSLEKAKRRFRKYPGGTVRRHGIWGYSESTFLDFDKKCTTLPIAINGKNSDELRDELSKLLFELKEIKQKKGHFLHIEYCLRILKSLNIKNFIVAVDRTTFKKSVCQ